MSNEIIPHTAEEKERMTDALAHALRDIEKNNAQAVPTIAANYGIDPDTLLETLATDAGMGAALARAEQLRQSGELLKLQSLSLVEKLVDQAEDMANAGQITPSMLPKLMDTMFKLSGLAEERAARLRAQTEDDTPKAAIHILYGDEPEPIDPKGNKYRIVIRLPNAQREAGDIIDVTPSEGEGGSDGA